MRKKNGIAPSVDVSTFYNKNIEQKYYNNLEILKEEYENLRNIDKLDNKN